MPRKRVQITSGLEVRPLKKGGYAVRWRIPAHDGKPMSKSEWKKIPEAKTKKQAERAAAKYADELEEAINDYTTKTDIELGEYAKRWHEDRKDSDEVKQSTWNREESLVAAILETSIAKIPLDEIVEEDIDQFKKEANKAGWSKDKQAKTLRKLKQILKFAESRRVIRHDPSRYVKGVKVKARERRYITKEEQKRILDALDQEEKDGHRAAVRITMATGFRMGEVLGLRWQDVHLEPGGSVIRLRWQLNRDNELTPPKHDEIRDIPLDDITSGWLNDWKSQIARETGKKRQDLEQTPVCPNSKGGYLTHTNFSRWWRKWAVDHELGTFSEEYTTEDASGTRQKHRIGYDGYTFHELRHTMATELLGSGADLKTTSAWLGHKSVRATEKYLHSITENMIEAGQKIAMERMTYDPAKEEQKKRRKKTMTSRGATVPHNPKWD